MQGIHTPTDSPSPADWNQLLHFTECPGQIRQQFQDSSILWSVDAYSPPHSEFTRVQSEAELTLMKGYQWDALSELARQTFPLIFGSTPERKNVAVLFSPTGTAANRLATSAVLNSGRSMIVADNAHVIEREAGAAAYQTGSTLHVVDCNGEFLTSDRLKEFVTARKSKYWITQQPLVVSISNPTENGRVYPLETIKELAKTCHELGLLLHVDGARIFLACAHHNQPIQSLTSDLGVDTLALGGTKCWMHKAEATVFLPSFFEHYGTLHLFKDSETSWNEFRSILKRNGGLQAQSSGVAAQFLRAFSNNFYLELGQQTNAVAKSLADGISQIRNCRIAYPVESNVVIVSMPKDAYQVFSRKYTSLMIWRDSDPQCPENIQVRFISNYRITKTEVSETIECLRRCCAAA